MRKFQQLKKDLNSHIVITDNVNSLAFVRVEMVLCLLSRISPELNPWNAYVLLRGYQIINHSKEDEQLYLLQQAREKLLLYASRMQWEEHLDRYLDSDYDESHIVAEVGLSPMQIQENINFIRMINRLLPLISLSGLHHLKKDQVESQPQKNSKERQ